jgi:hypothetical protein
LQGLFGPGLFISSLSHEVHSDVVAEFDTEAKTGDQVDDKDCIHFDRIRSEDLIEHPHGAKQLEQHKEHTQTDYYCNTQTAQDLERQNNCGNA